jgi:hypothetical protein
MYLPALRERHNPAEATEPSVCNTMELMESLASLFEGLSLSPEIFFTLSEYIFFGDF